MAHIYTYATYWDIIMNEVEAVRTDSQLEQVEVLLTEHSQIFLDIWKLWNILLPKVSTLWLKSH